VLHHLTRRAPPVVEHDLVDAQRDQPTLKTPLAADRSLLAHRKR
jgi:hypothetical protein